MPLPKRSKLGGHNALANVSNSTMGRESNLRSKLANKDFLLDIMSAKDCAVVEKEIRRLGGKVVYYFNEEHMPYLVVSDHPIAEKMQKRGFDLNSIKPEMRKKLPMLLKEAALNKVKIRCYQTFMQNLNDLKNKMRSGENSSQVTTKKEDDGRPRRLTAPYIKIEDKSGEFAPCVKEMSEDSNHTLYIGRYFGNSLFSKASTEQQQRRNEELSDEANGIYEYEDEEQQKTCMVPKIKKEGYCEICQKQCNDIRSHYETREHQNIISRKGFYDELDVLLGSYISTITCPGKPFLRRPRQMTERDCEVDIDSYEFSEGSALCPQ